VGRRLTLLLAPFALASSLILAAPGTALAANGMTETGNTTYEVLPAQAVIKVTVSISIANHKPNDALYYYYWNKTQITVEKEASAVSATSNAGKVRQKALKSDDYYRYIELDYPDVLYGQTRVVTATYTIPAAPKAPGGYRALSAYASLCALGNGEDTGSLSVVLPAGFDLTVDSGSDLSPTTDKSGRQVYSTGTQAAPYKLWSCVDAENESKLTETTVLSGTQSFTLQSWPEDKAWSDEIRTDVVSDVPALEELTGLTMPGGMVKIVEAGQSQLGDASGVYSADRKMSYISETVEKATVAHELSHIWFNKDLFSAKWMSEGLAGYSEQASGAGNFTPCKEPGTYPGTGSPNIANWVDLTAQPTKQDLDVLDYEYAASCYVFTSLSDSMGADNFRNVLQAATDDVMAYQGSLQDEQLDGAALPLTSRQMLDLIDEIGMVPGGVGDLDQAGDLLVKYGVFDAGSLDARSAARTRYHGLVTAAKTWKMPLAVREPMATWSFVDATDEMSTVQQILDLRSKIESTVKGLTLDGTQIQKDFESAKTPADLEAVLALARSEADAAGVVAKAIGVHDGDRSFLQSVGLMGVDVETKFQAARADLAAVKPDAATAEAQSVIDTIDQSNDQGFVRAAAATVTGLVVALLLLLFLVVLIRRRGRKPLVVAAAGYAGYMPAGPSQPFGYQPPAPGWGQSQMPGQAPVQQWPPAVGQAPAPQWPPLQPAPQWPPAGGQEPGQVPQWPPVAPAHQWPPAAEQATGQPPQWPPAEDAPPSHGSDDSSSS
jgi:hypothetical protein